MLSTVHVIYGLFIIILFLLTGQYMDIYHQHLESMADGPRLLYRSAHIYILLSSIINIAFGYGTKAKKLHLIDYLFSTILFIVPVFFLLAFFYEPDMKDLLRPFTRIAAYISLFVGLAMSMAYFLVNRSK